MTDFDLDMRFRVLARLPFAYLPDFSIGSDFFDVGTHSPFINISIFGLSAANDASVL